MPPISLKHCRSFHTQFQALSVAFLGKIRQNTILASLIKKSKRERMSTKRWNGNKQNLEQNSKLDGFFFSCQCARPGTDDYQIGDISASCPWNLINKFSLFWVFMFTLINSWLFGKALLKYGLWIKLKGNGRRLEVTAKKGGLRGH